MSKYVVDTHTLVWFFNGDKKLSKKAFTILENKNQEIIIPTIVLCELMYIAKKVSIDFETTLKELKIRLNCEFYPLDLEVVEKIIEIDKVLEIHDKIIVASAKLLNASIITKDKEIQKIYSKTVW